MNRQGVSDTGNKRWANLLLALAMLFVLIGQAWAEQSETVTYYHTDGLGSVIAASDENGNLLWRERYRPFGERLEKAVSTDEHALSYAGKPHDDAISLTYFGARYYDPVVGRFMSIDPAGVDPGNLHSFNRYAYANNNPYRYVDPDGNLPILVPLAIFLAKEIGAEAFERATGLPALFSVTGAAKAVGKKLVRSGTKGAVGQGIKSIRHGPTNPGPLDNATAATFRSGSYTATTVSETTTLYRVYGGSAGKLGRYWSRTKPSGPLQSQLDSALVPQWGNTAKNVVRMKVPKGTTIFEGAAAPQSTGVGQILGGGNQVYVPRADPKWIQ